MKFKIIYNGPIYIEAEATSEEERKVCVKGIKHTLEDLQLGYIPENVEETQEEENRTAKLREIYPDLNLKVISNSIQNSQPVERLATDKQKEFMTKLGIRFDQFTTMVQAADMIRLWKEQHGYKQ